MSIFTQYTQPFFTWWSEGLHKGLPVSLHKWVEAGQAKLILLVEVNGVVKAVWQQDGKQQERGEFSLHDKSELDFSDFIPKKYRKKKYYIDLRLAKKQVLFLQKEFPESIKDNLTQAIRYQIDRLTPFSSDNVYFDAVVGSHDKKSKNIVTNIFVASRHIVEKTILSLKERGVDRVDSISVAGYTQPLNLTTDGMPSVELHSKVSRKPLYFMLVVLVVSLVLPVAYKQRRIDQLDVAITDLRKNASEQLAIRDKLFEAEEALGFLKEKRASSPMALDVVNILAGELPKDTWLERLELNNTILEIRGESEKALALIDLLEESSSFSNVRFNYPVALNKKNKRDKFHIQATVEVPHG